SQISEMLGTRLPRADEMDAYERVLGDAMHGDATLFAREDYVEEAWRIVDPVLKAGTPVYEYEPGTWGPKEVDSRVAPPGGWQNPTVKHLSKPRPWPTPMRSRGRVRRSRPRRRERRSPRVAASSWPLAGDIPRGRCFVHWPMKRCHGAVCTWSKWTSAWLRRETPTATSPICAKACSRIVRCAPSRFMPWRWNRTTWKRRVGATPWRSGISPASRPSSISFISALDPTATPRRWCPGMRCSTSPARTSRSPASIKDGAG